MVDATGQVSCSTPAIPRGERGPVVFETSLDGVTARLTAEVVGSRWLPEWRRPRLELADASARWTVELKPHPQAFRHEYHPSAVRFGDAAPALCLVRFAGRAQPWAVTAVYAGGAHCCTDVRLHDLGSRSEVELHAMNYPARVQLLDGAPYLVHGDNDFSYAFSSFADSCPPVQVFRPEQAGFRDVTTDFPDVLRRDARRWWHYAEVRDREPLGFYACWAADEERLGNDDLVWSTLEQLADSGSLRQPYYRDIDGDDFIPALRTFLREHGYLEG